MSVKWPEDVIDVTGLPPELLQQLSKPLQGKKSKESDIRYALVLAGKPVSIDWLLVTIYRQTGDVWTRAQISSLLHRMVKRGVVQQAGRGVYALPST